MSHSETGIPFCTGRTPHFISAVQFSFLTLRQRHTARSERSCTISLYLPFTSQRLIRDYIYGEEKGKWTVKYVYMSWTWERCWLFFINNGTGPRPRPLALRLPWFPFRTSKATRVWLCECARALACPHLSVYTRHSLWETACGEASFYLIRSGAASTSTINVLTLIHLSTGDAASFVLLIGSECKKEEEKKSVCFSTWQLICSA